MKSNILLLLILISAFYSCSYNNQDFQLPLECYNADRRLSNFKMIKAQVSFTNSIQEYQAEFIDSLVIIEGDIILGRAEYFSREGLTVITSTGKGKLWTNGIIPYTITNGHPSKDLIIRAINEVNSQTNLNLVPRIDEKDYINFIKPSSERSCSSSVGRQGGSQNVYIGSSCPFGSIIHEILHASGFYHEQSRTDRDKYIKVLYENINPNHKYNFERYMDKREYNGLDINNYDYGSIMHYGFYSFSKNGEKTIELKIPPADPSTIIGQRIGLSPNDILSINLVYPNRFSSSD